MLVRSLFIKGFCEIFECSIVSISKEDNLLCENAFVVLIQKNRDKILLLKYNFDVVYLSIFFGQRLYSSHWKTPERTEFYFHSGEKDQKMNRNFRFLCRIPPARKSPATGNQAQEKH